MSKKIQTAFNAILRPTGLELVRQATANPHVPGYLSAIETVKAARARGVTVCDYLEMVWDESGNTQAVIHHMAKFGVFDSTIAAVCEIGPGTGRFTEKTLEKCRPITYECYEPDRQWAEWLRTNYRIIL